MKIVDHIRARADERPEQVAVVVAGRSAGDHESFTYSSLIASVDMRSATVRAAVRGTAARVGLVAPQGVDFIATALAILDAGCCLVPIPDESAASASAAFARDAGLHALVRVADGALSVESIEGAAPPRAEFVDLDPAYLRFTSGTTAERKGVVLSHSRILERLDAANRGMRITAGDRVLWLLPMAHHFVVSILLYLRHGAAVLLPASSLASAILDLAEKVSPTVLYASPYHYNLLASDASARSLDAVRLAVSTAEGLRADIAMRFRERFAIDLVQALGIIEVGLPVMNLASAATKPAALGRPLPDFEVWLRGDDGVPVGEGSSPERTGEVCVRGPGMFDAYLDPWTPSRSVLDPDGFRTGDQGWFDTDGDLHLVGRRANRINMAGMKFFSEEVEAVLDRHPAVRCSRVAARDHAHLGQIPVAEIVLRPGCDMPPQRELADHCRAALPSYKIPRQFTAVASLPMTATGKVRRH